MLEIMIELLETHKQIRKVATAESDNKSCKMLNKIFKKMRIKSRRYLNKNQKLLIT